MVVSGIFVPLLSLNVYFAFISARPGSLSVVFVEHVNVGYNALEVFFCICPGLVVVMVLLSVRHLYLGENAAYVHLLPVVLEFVVVWDDDLVLCGLFLLLC